MRQIIKYLLFLGFLAAALIAAANFDLTSLSLPKPQKSGVVTQKSFRGVTISQKPSAILSGLSGVVSFDYAPASALTAAAADDQILIWQLPETTPLREIACGPGFQVLSLRFLAGGSLIAVGGMNNDNTGSIKIFDALSGTQKLQFDEAEPIISLDSHPNGKQLLITGESYIKVIELKDGNLVAIMQKSSPVSRGSFYGNGNFILQSDTLSLYDVNKRALSGAVDKVSPLFFRKGMDGATFSWLSAEGVTIVTAGQPGKKFFPVDTRGVLSFDVDKQGTWGLFLLDGQKMALRELATGKTLKTISLGAAAADVLLTADGYSAYVQFTSGAIGVFDVGYQNKLKSLKFALKKFVGSIKSKATPVEKPVDPQ